MLCAVAAVGLVGLKVHFDGILGDSTETGGGQPAARVAGLTGTIDDDGGSGQRPLAPDGPAVSADDTDDTPDTSVPPPADDPAKPDELTDRPEVVGWVDPASSGRPWSDLGAVEGLLTFRGNPTRTFYGAGPVPEDPDILWTHEIGCSVSPVGGEAKQWCGSGWTGQPAVFPDPTDPSGASMLVAFGGYDRQVTILDPATGAPGMAPYATGDIIKGSITVDPDGYPLLYTGSRDNFFHVVALDRDVPEALWRLASDAGGPTLWNNDWDGSALVVDDHLFVGGENSRFYIVALNRGYDSDGLVTVDPEIVFTTEGWDDELLAAIGDVQVSVENSVAISGDTVYFTNSGGLVQGWNFAGLADGATPERVFRFWTGDDTDATIVIDADGMLYLGSEYERLNARSQEIGQVVKLDPTRPDDPVVWRVDARSGPDSGVWATPALWQDLVLVATDDGDLLALDQATGAERWRLSFPGGPVWSSPVVVDDVLVQAACDGFLRAFDLVPGATEPPAERWAIELGGCVESTPAVWGGRIFVGSRSGTFFAVGDPALASG